MRSILGERCKRRERAFCEGAEAWISSSAWLHEPFSVANRFSDPPRTRVPGRLSTNPMNSTATQSRRVDRLETACNVIEVLGKDGRVGRARFPKA